MSNSKSFKLISSRRRFSLRVVVARCGRTEKQTGPPSDRPAESLRKHLACRGFLNEALYATNKRGRGESERATPYHPSCPRVATARQRANDE